MRFHIFLLLILSTICAVSAEKVTDAAVTIDGTKTIAQTDDNFVCATIDWWPKNKCDYGNCPWGLTSVTTMNLSRPLLAKAIEAFQPLRIRIGGSLQDQVLYNIGLKTKCNRFSKQKDGLFGFSQGCLLRRRWDELNLFFKKTGAILTFGLNALHGRRRGKGKVYEGAWDPSNAESFINYTVSKGYQIESWEFGNELCGDGIGASVDAEQYAKDTITLKAVINKYYKNSKAKPSLVAPGGFYDRKWFGKLLQVSGSNVVNGVSHHIYNIGAGVDHNLIDKILNVTHLNLISETFHDLQEDIEKNGPWASAWVGEAGGAYNSGGDRVSNTFVNSFWYLDQLGMTAKYHTKVYCRQALVGGFYGLLNSTTFLPNPDYFSALLWHRLMGKGVLSVESKASPNLRVYAHCSKGQAGVTMILINLSKDDKFKINPNLQGEKKDGAKTSGPSHRDEYHLTPENGNLRSQTMLLNGKPLKLTGQDDIPSIDPNHVDINSPVLIAPESIAFVRYPNFHVPACA